MGMPGRKVTSEGYRYGFNGQEKSTELDQNGNSMTAEYWQYDARLGRRWNVDPRANPSISPLSAFGNSPIFFMDVLGDTTVPSSPAGFAREGGSNGYLLKLSQEVSYQTDGRIYFVKDNNGDRFFIMEVPVLKSSGVGIHTYWDVERYYYSERPLSKGSPDSYSADAHWVPFLDAADQHMKVANEFVDGYGTILMKTALYAPTFFAGGGAGAANLVVKGWYWRAGIDAGGQMVTNGFDVTKLDVADVASSAFLAPGANAAFGGAVDVRPFASVDQIKIVGYNKRFETALIDFGFKYATGGNGAHGSFTNYILKNAGSQAYSKSQEVLIKETFRVTISVPFKAVRNQVKTSTGL